MLKARTIFQYTYKKKNVYARNQFGILFYELHLRTQPREVGILWVTPSELQLSELCPSELRPFLEGRNSEEKWIYSCLSYALGHNSDSELCPSLSYALWVTPLSEL